MLLALLSQAGDGGAQAALYAAGGLVLSTAVGGFFAWLTAKRSPDTKPTIADEPTTYALPREMAGMLVEVIAERDLWKHRAEDLGWTP